MMNILNKLVLSAFTLLTFSQAWAIPPAVLSGTWLHDGKPTSVRAGNNYNFIFCNENNDCTDGLIHSGGQISVNRWNVTGKLNPQGNVIHWSNGTRWIRPENRAIMGTPAIPGNQAIPGNPAIPGNQVIVINKNFGLHRLNGPWTHNGKPTSISVSPDAKQFTITNEEGRSDTGYFDRHKNLILPSLNIVGHPNKHMNYIEWNNGTAWHKR